MDLKLQNLIKNAQSGPVLSKFLTVEDQKLVENSDLEVRFSDCYPGEERKRAILFPKKTKAVFDFNISILKITAKEELKHSDVLGAIMSLGITREVIGDIIIGDSVYVIVASEIEKYLLENLTQIKHGTVTAEHVDQLEDYGQNPYVDSEIIIPSLRLDVILSKALNLSREKSQNLIGGKQVKINGNIITDNDRQPNFGDIVSVTKYGRITIQEISRKTKKDKLVLKIGRTK